MREDTVLDHVELQLSSPRSSRCELFIAAEGETEKLACGFLKTFLSHVRVAQELHAAGAQLTLRLEGPHVFNGSRRPWFTKGTLERFVEYVSTPEVLERVKTIEDELAQLEQVRSIQAGSLSQVNDAFANPTVLRAGVIPADYHQGHCPYSAASNEVDDSKRELLKAMDVRLSALQQEQNMAFSRAAAAGFDVDRIEDLLAFSEFFGADRLRVACNWFCELCGKQQRAALKPVHQGYQEISSQGNVLSAIENDEIEAGSSWRASRVNASGELRGVDSLAPMSDELATVSPVRPPQLQGNMSKGLPQRTSPRRRSASPLKKVQVGRFGSRRPGSVVIRSINYFSSHDRPSKERNNTMETSSSDSEDNAKSYILDEPATAITSSPAAARRLSVQAAINLFESKQCKEIDEAQGKQRCIKQESRRGSLEGINTSISEIVDSRQYVEMGNCIVSSSGMHERVVPYPTLDLECISDNYKSRMDHVIRSPGRFPNPSNYSNTNYSNTTGLSSEIDSEELLCYQGSWQQSFTGQKKCSSPREALNLRRGSSTSEDLLASELDSVGSSPLSRRVQLRHEHIDSDTSNAKSTLTSISQGGASVESSLYCPTPSSPAIAISSVVHDLQNSEGHKSQKIFKNDSLFVENEPSSYTFEEGNIPSKYKNSRNCMLPSDFSIQALASMADSSSVNDEVLGRNEGRFYEQYRKLRDAKMMEEQQSKRAEREAKLRLMEETLELRKAEMDARTAKLNKDSYHARARAAKLLALKASLGDIQRVQEDAVIGHTKTLALTKDCTRSDSSPPSPPLTPRAVKEQALTPKLHRAKKAVIAAQKSSSTTPRSSTRVASVSPKTTPKGMVGKPSSHRSSVSSNIAENPLACSVPCFSDLKKENTKPSPGKPSGSARVHSKNNGAGVHPPVTNRASLLESNGSVPFQNSSSNKATRADRKNHAWQTRHSYATAEFKGLTTASEDEIPVVLNATKIETPVFSKIRRSAVAPIQEVRPFLRKGSGIGPGAGPGVMKLKADAVKSSDEDAPGTPLKNSDEEAPMIARNITDTSDGENMTMEETGAKIPPCLSFHTSGEKEVEAETLVMSDIDATHYSDGGLFSLCEEAKLDKPCKDDELLDNERACHTISFPIDFVMHERYAATFASEPDFASQEPRVEVTRREGETSATLSQLLSESASQVLQNESSVNGSASFRATLSADQQSASRFSPMKAASLASSSLKRLGVTIPDYFSPSAVTLVESPLGSPASWNSSQVQYASETDATRSQKKSGSSQKPVVMVVPPKEPAKGLKRLLKFGRKSRATPEIIITDGVSASTPSEGDEDLEDVKELSMHSAQDLLRKVKLQERLLKDFGIAGLSGDHGNTRDKGSVQSLQNSIPIPPSNFKLKYDHAPGSSKLKAPRSFFSLSTFRSRGSEGKSR